MKTLFDEVIEALTFVRILDEQETIDVMNDFIKSFPFTTVGCGKIDWKNISNHISLENITELKNYPFIDRNAQCFIIWNEMTLPIIESNIGSVVDVFDDIIAVSFDTWMFIPKTKNVLESTFGSLRVTNNFK